jgi:ABC-type sugar transport system ATPase subunit
VNNTPASHTRPGRTWLELEAVEKTYKGVNALTNVTFSLREGEIRGLIGANGAGKSTLIRVLTGETAPDGGSMRIDGLPVRFDRPADARRRGIAVMPQELTLAPHLTVAENILLGNEPRRNGRIDHRCLREMARCALERLGAAIPIDTPVDETSLVEQRLVMAARALAGNSRAILLDEPTAAMAPAEVHLVLELVRRLAAEGVACVYVSHRLDEIVELADHVTALRDGKVVAELDKASVSHDAMIDLISEELQVGGRRPRKCVSTDCRLRLIQLRGRRLQQLDLEIARGEIIGFAGLAGSGADEAISFASGLSSPVGGEIVLDGVSLPLGDRLAALNAGVAYLPGDRSLARFPNHDVRENVTITSLAAYRRLGLPSKSRERSAIVPLLDRVGFRRSDNVTIGTLSGGNQQKALFARQLTRNLSVLVLDDPTAGVDVGARHEIHEQVRQLADLGVSVILASTDLDEVVALADRVVIFGRGTVTHELTGDLINIDEVIRCMTGGQSSATAEPRDAADATTVVEGHV